MERKPLQQVSLLGATNLPQKVQALVHNSLDSTSLAKTDAISNTPSPPMTDSIAINISLSPPSPPISGGIFPPLSLIRTVGPVSLCCALFVFYDLLALRTNCCLTDTCVQMLVPAYAIKSMYPGCYAKIPVDGTLSTTYYRIFPFPIAPHC